MVKNPAAHHAISAKFDKKVDNKGKTLVVQYEVKLQSEALIEFSSVLKADRYDCRWLGVWWSLSEATPG